jgi:hypothetical protein
MADPGGKKSRRGPRGEAKKKHVGTVDPDRNNALIESAGDPDTPSGILSRVLRDRIYRLLLLGSNCKVNRKTARWATEGWSHAYRFQVNLLRANKAIYAEAKQIL